ncbi:MAG: hypothetical protein KatS3mg102_0300 [Planctomycetota bacterium]|nr:MAG: hypothetical protein KatS3mg102_0300 [Planctomycetota bacterium]
MVQVFRYDRTEQPPARSGALRQRWEQSRLLAAVFATLLRQGRLHPERIPAIHRLVARTYFRPRERVAAAPEVLTIPMPPRHLEVEYAIPCERTVQALERLHARIAAERLRVGFVVEVRFVAADRALMSPCYGRPSCMIVAGGAPGRATAQWFAAFEETMAALDGRPHWGKQFAMPHAELRRRLPGLERFAAIRARLDPRGTLLNRFAARVLGLEPPAAAAGQAGAGSAGRGTPGSGGAGGGGVTRARGWSPARRASDCARSEGGGGNRTRSGTRPGGGGPRLVGRRWCCSRCPPRASRWLPWYGGRRSGWASRRAAWSWRQR